MERSQPQLGSGRDAGFSLLEIMIALVILALAMGVVGVAFVRSSAGFRFDTATQDLALSLREAQARALRSGREVAVAIDVEGHRYQLAQDTSVALPEGAGVRVISAGEVMGPGRDPIFVFSPDGSSTGGKITLSEQDRSATISVDWLTGSIGVVNGGANAPSP